MQYIPQVFQNIFGVGETIECDLAGVKSNYSIGKRYSEGDIVHSNDDRNAFSFNPDNNCISSRWYRTSR